MRIKPNTIIMIESEGRHNKITFEGGEFTTYKSLMELVGLSGAFIYVNKGQIVNCMCIESVNDSAITLMNGSVLYFSKRLKKGGHSHIKRINPEVEFTSDESAKGIDIDYGD